ncbi:MAG: SCP2 sterol-binding domain-containing protein [Oscillospiraceae bacterium]|nr:SCP2 sterol-binding domain-containing protein [Oscillospiraceae bacterium]
MSEKFKNVIEEVKNRTAKFDPTSYNGFLAIQVTLTDLGEVFYIEIKDGKMSIEPHEYNDRQANIIMKSDNFIKTIYGELNTVFALTTGKLKIEGDLTKAKELSSLFKGGSR